MRKKNLRYMVLVTACCTAFATACGGADQSGASEAAAETAAEQETEADADAESGEEADNAGAPGDQQPGEKPEGEPPAGPDGEGGPGGEGAPGGNPPAKPDGEGGPGGQGGPGGPGGMGGPGGGASKPESYDAVVSYDKDASVKGRTFTSEGKDESAILVEDGSVSIEGATVTRTSDNSVGGDRSSFYGTGAAVLCTGGTLKLGNSEITSDAAGGAGVFSYGDGVVYVSDTTISTEQGTSGGIHAAGGGTLYADNVTAVTNGASSAAIRSDRGGGTMVVTGGSYTSNGTGSPAVYCTADIMVSNADLAATGSEAVCIEGLNSLKLTDCNLSGSMPDDEQNDHSWTVIVYQSMSGDSEIGRGSFSMSGGSLTSTNGGLFYTTNTESEFTLQNVLIKAAKDCEYLLQCTGNANARGWGSTGENGAKCTFNAIRQSMEGNVIWDSISTLDFYLTEGSALAGAVINDESWSGKTAEEARAPDFIWTKKQDPASPIVLPLAVVMDCIFLNLPPGLTAGREKACFLKLTPRCWKSSRIIA